MIKINENIFITVDTYNVVLNEKKINSKTGEEYLDVLGYYPTIDMALKGLLKKEIKKLISKEEVMSLKEAIKQCEKIEKEITGISKNF